MADLYQSRDNLFHFPVDEAYWVWHRIRDPIQLSSLEILLDADVVVASWIINELLYFWNWLQQIKKKLINGKYRLTLDLNVVDRFTVQVQEWIAEWENECWF